MSPLQSPLNLSPEEKEELKRLILLKLVLAALEKPPSRWERFRSRYGRLMGWGGAAVGLLLVWWLGSLICQKADSPGAAGGDKPPMDVRGDDFRPEHVRRLRLDDVAHPGKWTPGTHEVHATYEYVARGREYSMRGTRTGYEMSLESFRRAAALGLDSGVGCAELVIAHAGIARAIREAGGSRDSVEYYIRQARKYADGVDAPQTADVSGPALRETLTAGGLPDDVRLSIKVRGYGTMVVRLHARDAPKNVTNVANLAIKGFYNGLTFHRITAGLVAQGGDPKGDGTGGTGYTVEAEIGRKHLKGSLAMARTADQINSGRRSSGSQFYLCLQALPQLDGEYTVIGDMVDGFDALDRLGQVRTGAMDRPVNPVVIESMTVSTPSSERQARRGPSSGAAQPAESHNPTVIAARAIVALAAGDSASAWEAWRAGVEFAGSEYATPRLMQVFSLMATRPADQVGFLKPVADSFPNYAELQNQMGAAYVRANLPDSAEKRFRLALLLSPDFVEARRNLAKLEGR